MPAPKTQEAYDRWVENLSKSHLGQVPPNKGKPMSMEQRELLKKVHKGKVLTPEHRENIRCAMKGRIFTAEWRKKLSAKAHASRAFVEAGANARRGIPISLERRKRQSELMKGENAPNWKGGITEKNSFIRNSLEYRLWREAVFRRDYWTCASCGYKGRKIEAHHVKPFSTHPELRLAIDNGITLCDECHQILHSLEERN